jgi:putative heme-binding domain-containing protein
MLGFSVAQCLGQAADLVAFEHHAMEHSGDAGRGRVVFNAAGSMCASCHSIDGSGGKVGPDLGAIGDKFGKRDLIRSVLEPAATVAVGYGTTTIRTKDGQSRVGVIKSSGAEVVELMGVDGVVVKVPAGEIASQSTADVSLMPAGLHAAMGLEGFTDLIAYLESLRAATGGGLPGSPERIPLASRPAELVPLSATAFDHPTWFGWIPGRGTDAALVLEHAGRIWRLDQKGKESRELVLDLRGVVRQGGATGLLGMDFHPGYGMNRRYFLKYQVVEDGVISTVIEERAMRADRDVDSGNPGRQLLKIRSVTQDHNGGSIGFGPDGFLYFGMGDTGPQRDPQGHGQDMSMLLGKLMRIDVDGRDAGLGYAVPADNPFVGKEGIRPEIWASGFREPYRLSWDSKTGDLWVGDVGQDRIEEVSIVRRGENHGWNVYEGHQPFSERFRRTGETYVPPVMSYSHRHGVSVTGGHVYRGTKAPRLEGWYVFGDYESRRIWALTQRDRQLGQVVEIARAPTRITAFARDPDGELYGVGFNDGMIYRLALEGVDPRPLETRVVAETSERTPVSWRVRAERPAAEWSGESFDDSAWRVAPGGFGSEGTPGGVIRSDWRGADLWLRREFQVAPDLAAAAGDLLLRLHHDEDVEVFLNGREVLHRQGWTREYIDERIEAALKPGRNVLAIHCHQNGGGQFIDAGLLKTVAPGP